MQVRDALQRLAGIAEPPLEPIVPCEPEIFHYRNKLEYSFTPTPDGRRRSASTGPAAGTRCSRSSAAGSPTSSATGSATPSATGRARRGSRRTRRRTGAATSATSSSARAATRGQALVQLVTAPGERFETGYLVDVLRRFPEVRSIHWSVNDTPAEVTNLPTRLLWGEEWIEEELGGLRFRVRPNAFLQTNTAMAERLYALAGEAAGLTGDETVWDLYCGIGTIGLSLAARRADGLGDRGLGGVGRLRARERRAERDHERGLLRRQRRRGRRGAARALRPAGRRRRRSAARRPGRQGAAPARPDRRAAARLRLVQPDDARRRREGSPRGLRLRAAARDAGGHVPAHAARRVRRAARARVVGLRPCGLSRRSTESPQEIAAEKKLDEVTREVAWDGVRQRGGPRSSAAALFEPLGIDRSDAHGTAARATLIPATSAACATLFARRRREEG